MKVYIPYLDNGLFDDDHELLMLGVYGDLAQAEKVGRATLEEKIKDTWYRYSTFKVEEWTVGMPIPERIYLY